MPRTEALLIPGIMALLPQLPKSPLLLCTAMRFVGAYASWLRTNPTHLTPSFTMLAQAISGAPAMCAAAAQPTASTETKEGSKRFLAEAAAAFKLVCDINAEHIVGVPHDSLLSLIAQVGCFYLPLHFVRILLTI